ncbi:unnamed protein product [Protopolystoma xenopodis]|uniref:Uncharacterized protein n=1 Tax=Protopolystoma xenopodis TaxID=117903 RepID=A0A3S5CTW8_9PLAT|nr:unnamed protein product [Protopolystoma xenopodis]
MDRLCSFEKNELSQIVCEHRPTASLATPQSPASRRPRDDSGITDKPLNAKSPSACFCACFRCTPTNGPPDDKWLPAPVTGQTFLLSIQRRSHMAHQENPPQTWLIRPPRHNDGSRSVLDCCPDQPQRKHHQRYSLESADDSGDLLDNMPSSESINYSEIR